MPENKETPKNDTVSFLVTIHDELLGVQKEFLDWQLQVYQKFLAAQLEQQHYIMNAKIIEDPVVILDAFYSEDNALSKNDFIGKTEPEPLSNSYLDSNNHPAPITLSREQLEILSSGKISDVFGSQFAGQDQYSVQVRLPAPPLLLCDRITKLEGTPGSMGLGSVWSELDIKENGWYLCNGRISAGPFLEAGQAHLLLISWLGADAINQGKRCCRLLGSEIIFHGPPPKIGETLEYRINISNHASIGDARIYFFESEGWVNGKLLVSVKKGQAGFFTQEELSSSSGVMWNEVTADYTEEPRVEAPVNYCRKTHFTRQEMEFYRKGNVYECLGDGFEKLQTHTRTPRSIVGEHFFLDEVTSFDPYGGPKKRGYMAARTLVNPDSWFFKAHFKNDPCMPGTLMWEGCLQMMSLYLTALGFTKDNDGWRFEPVTEQKYTFLCRGQVTPHSKVISYEVFVDELIAEPYPTIFAHIVCTVDGLKAFVCNRMGLRLVPDWPLTSMSVGGSMIENKTSVKHKDYILNYEKIMQGALGQPSHSFGDRFKVFDDYRKMPRLPGPPFLFMTRIKDFKGEMGDMSMGSQVTVEYDIPRDAWYFHANGVKTMPFCVLLEIALQACGWLAISESAPNIEQDVLFRNLDGKARQFGEVSPEDEIVTTRVVLQSISNVGNMIIQSFKADCFVDNKLILELDTVFGFFPPNVMLEQKGLQISVAEQEMSQLTDNMNLVLTDSPQSYFKDRGCRLPIDNLLMIERITGYWPDKGRYGKGLLRAQKKVNASDWFFKAHFFQDPVQPGSLGIEAILQLFQFYMLEHRLDLGRDDARFEPVMLNHLTEWHYRGQVVPSNANITIEIEIEEQKENDDSAYVLGSGRLWVDGLKIYEVPSCGMRIIGKRAVNHEKQEFLVSAGQEGIWIQAQNSPDSFIANIPVAFKLGDDVSVDRLANSILAAIANHPILLSNFMLKEDKLVRIVDPHKKIKVKIQDFPSHSFEDLEPYIKEFIEVPFDLIKDDLIRVTFYKYDGNKYLLLFVIHHIVFDGTSLPIFLNEVRELYNAVPSHNTLVDMNNYEVYVKAQKDLILSQTGQEQLAYWKRELVGPLPILDLKSFKTNREEKPLSLSFMTEIDHISTFGLKNLAKRTGISLFSLFLTAYKILLTRYSGQKETIVGIPFSGRKDTGFKHTLGYLVNLLAIRTGITEGMTIRDFSLHTNKKVYDAIFHGDFPFEEVVRELHLKRTNHSNPVFQASFAYQNWANIYVNNPNQKENKWVLDPVFEIHDFTPDHLSLEIIEYGDRFKLYFKYNAHLFDALFIKQMAQHYQNILAKMDTLSEHKVASIKLISDEELNKILTDFNDTKKAYPRHKTIQQLFEEQVERTPDKTALVFENQSLSYRELNEKANILANLLRNKGVGPDKIIGLMLERSTELIVSIIAILKAGGAYLPIDPDYPEDRIRFMLEDSAVDLLLIQSCINNQNAWSCKTLLVDHLNMLDGNKSNPPMINKADDLIYVIYTSGSTGNPKGVMITHGNVNNFIQGVTDKINFSQGKTLLCVTTISFDIFVLETLLPLTKGLKVVLANKIDQSDPEKLAIIIRNNNVDMIQMTPSRIRMILENHSEILKPLSEIMLGGEKLPQAVLKQLRKITTAKLYNMYGPTETTVWSTLMEMTDSRGLIGNPISNTQIYILDQNKQLLPCGIMGELYISGAGLARGYLNQPELTSEKFIANPFNPGTKMYRTGDLARWLPDGTLEFFGRIDHQVKIRGYRIELGEIESILTSLQNIKEAVVVAKEDESGSHYLCAYLVCVAEWSTQALREHLMLKLPEFMVPSYFVRLTQMPLTPNGKIDRKALPEPTQVFDTAIAYVKPENEIEFQLIPVWKDVLKIKQIGITDNFFELGGHSLKAFILINKLNKILSKHISIRDLFNYPTIKALGAYLTSGLSQTSELINLKQEATLDEDINIGQCTVKETDVKSLLFTGSTGFVGGFILKELLVETDWYIYCLVRSETKESGYEKIKQHMINYELWDEQYANRIHVVLGDMGKEKLGMDESDYHFLAETIDVILHNATFMNHLATYGMLKPVNIGGLKEVLRFAVCKRLKCLQYVSTMSIFNEITPRDNYIIDETSPIENELHTASDGYETSKWVAEKIVDIAKSRGIPCNIFRLGLVTGDCEKGRYSREQWLYQLVKSCFTMKHYFKELDTFRWPITPVDFVAKALVYIAKQEDIKNRIFHLINEQKVPISELFKNQPALNQIDLFDWLQMVKNCHSQEKEIPILPLIEDYLETPTEEIPNVISNLWRSKIIFRNKKTLNELENGQITFPEINEELYGKYIRFICQDN